jgi:hypothetical protein
MGKSIRSRMQRKRARVVDALRRELACERQARREALAQQRQHYRKALRSSHDQLVCLREHYNAQTYRHEAIRTALGITRGPHGFYAFLRGEIQSILGPVAKATPDWMLLLAAEVLKNGTLENALFSFRLTKHPFGDEVLFNVREYVSMISVPPRAPFGFDLLAEYDRDTRASEDLSYWGPGLAHLVRLLLRWQTDLTRLVTKELVR